MRTLNDFFIYIAGIIIGYIIDPSFVMPLLIKEMILCQFNEIARIIKEQINEDSLYFKWKEKTCKYKPLSDYDKALMQLNIEFPELHYD
jgi:hypothetical protein